MKLKSLYWKLEALICEFYTRFLLIPGFLPVKAHCLPGKLVVSFTSYPPRFPKLHLTIKSLLEQSVRPDKIILWIAHDDEEKLPSSLKEYEIKYVWFEIRYCDDLRSFKKIIPALSAFPNDFIVTVDDDVFYSRKWLEGLCESWCGDNKEVVAYRAHKVEFNEDGSMKPYANWHHYYQNNQSGDCLFPTGIGGVLYPPGSLHHEVMNIPLFRELCPHADDVWLFWMERLNHSRVRIPKRKFNVINWHGTDHSGLAQENVNNNGNDRQNERLQRHYGLIQEIFN